MIDGLGIAKKKLIDRIITENFTVDDPQKKNYNYLELLYIIQEMSTEEGKKYFTRGLTKRGHTIFREFIKYLVYRNIANFDSMVLITSVKGCLDENTLIKTQEYGNISIKELVENKKDCTPLLYSLDKKTEKEVKSFGIIIDSGEQECFKMKTKSGKEIIATAKHPFFIKDINGNIKKIKLKDLKKGDKIIALENVMYFEEIKTIESVGLRKTYDFHVPEHNNFILGNEILTHNTGKSSAAIMMAKEWCRILGIKFNPKRHIAYTNADVMHKIDTLNKFEPLICVSGDTKILIKKNRKNTFIPIKEIEGKKNILIGSYNIKTGKKEFKKSEICICNGIGDVFEIELENGDKIKATKNHLFLTRNKTWKRLDELKEGDDIILNNEKECLHCKKIYFDSIQIKKHGLCSDNCKKLYKSIYLKKYNDENKVILKENKKIYIKENKEQISKSKKKWYNNNIIYCRKKNKKYVNENKEEIYKKNKIWKDKNPEKYRKSALASHHKRQKSNVLYRIKRAYRSRLYHAIKNNKYKDNKKDIKSKVVLGCSWEYFFEFIEKQFTKEMNWDNYGTYWSIAHISQCFKYDLSNIKQLKECGNYKNLRPLKKELNSKNGSIDYYRWKNENKKN